MNTYESAEAILQVRDLVKVYGKKDNLVTAVDRVSVDILKGSFTVIMGPSGSGKSTFMHCVAGLDSINHGRIIVDGIEITGMSSRKLTKFRRDHVGFVFQAFNLVPTLNAAENIQLPSKIAHQKIDQERFQQIVSALDLQDRLKHKPAELSGGQQQRVACARALLQKPAVLFADEPTGNLDSNSTAQVLSYLRKAVDEMGQTVVMVTHEPDAAAWGDRVLFMKDGQIVQELYSPTRHSVLETLGNLDTIPSLTVAAGSTPQNEPPVTIPQASPSEPNLTQSLRNEETKTFTPVKYSPRSERKG